MKPFELKPLEASENWGRIVFTEGTITSKSHNDEEASKSSWKNEIQREGNVGAKIFETHDCFFHNLPLETRIYQMLCTRVLQEGHGKCVL